MSLRVLCIMIFYSIYGSLESKGENVEDYFVTKIQLSWSSAYIFVLHLQMQKGRYAGSS